VFETGAQINFEANLRAEILCKRNFRVSFWCWW